MNSVMLSIRPKWCELIANGKKTMEVRKTRPKIETPFKCYIYETKARSDMPTFVDEDGHVIYTGRGQVIGEFVCDKIDVLFNDNGNPENYMNDILPEILKSTAMTYDEFGAYVGNRGKGKNIYGWLISDVNIYNEPKALREFVIVDKEAIRKCEHRFQSYYSFTDTGHIKNGFGCDENDDWCFGCKRKPLVRPPQSYMYVEELK